MAATLQTIADECRVSRATVSFALNGRTDQVGEAARARIFATAARLGYRPNAAARAVRTRSTRQVGVLIHDAGREHPVMPHVSDFVSGINAEIESAGYTTCLVELTDVESSVENMTRVFREEALDGMVVLAALQEPLRGRVAQLVPQCVWCDAGLREPEGCLWRDERAAGRLAAQALVEAGCRSIWFVQEPVRDTVQRPYTHDSERLAGVRESLQASGLPPPVVTAFDGEEVGDMRTALKRAGRGLGVIASNYSVAPAFVHVAAERGWIAGRDYALGCCDDWYGFQRQFPQLSRATYDRFALGERAARMLLEQLGKPDIIQPSHIDVPTWHAGTTASFRTQRNPNASSNTVGQRPRATITDDDYGRRLGAPHRNP